MERRTSQLIKYILLPLCMLVLLLYISVKEYSPDFLMRVAFLDIGQGDGIYIKTHQGTQVLIDGGPSSKILTELGKVMPHDDRSIDLLILTHPDADHVTGLVEVLKRYEVKQVMHSGFVSSSGVYAEYQRLLEENQVEVIAVRQGQRIWLDSATAFDIYWPGENVTESSLSTNDTSIYGKLTFGRTKILLTGDADSRVEDAVLPLFNLDADLLKVGHHGSNSSTSRELLQEVTPSYAVIQVGKDNTYGHPSPRVLGALEESGAEVSRTDIQGVVQFVSDGLVIWKIK